MYTGNNLDSLGQKKIDIDVAGKATKLSSKLTSLPSFLFEGTCTSFLPARASEQGNLVSVYIYIYLCTNFFCNLAN